MYKNDVVVLDITLDPNANPYNIDNVALVVSVGIIKYIDLEFAVVNPILYVSTEFWDVFRNDIDGVPEELLVWINNWYADESLVMNLTVPTTSNA